jgi:hypothetical protein
MTQLPCPAGRQQKPLSFVIFDEGTPIPPGFWCFGVDPAKPGADRTAIFKFPTLETASMKDWNDKGPMTIRERFVASALQGVLADRTTLGGNEICRDLDPGEIVDKAFAVTNIALARFGYGEPTNPQLRAYASSLNSAAAQGLKAHAEMENDSRTVRGHVADEHTVRVNKESSGKHGIGGSNDEVRFRTALFDFNRRREYAFLTRVSISILPAGTQLKLPRGVPVTIDGVSPYVPHSLFTGHYAKKLTRDTRLNSLPAGTYVYLPDTRHLSIEVELSEG